MLRTECWAQEPSLLGPALLLCGLWKLNTRRRHFQGCLCHVSTPLTLSSCTLHPQLGFAIKNLLLSEPTSGGDQYIYIYQYLRKENLAAHWGKCGSFHAPTIRCSHHTNSSGVAFLSQRIWLPISSSRWTDGGETK